LGGHRFSTATREEGRIGEQRGFVFTSEPGTWTLVVRLVGPSKLALQHELERGRGRTSQLLTNMNSKLEKWISLVIILGLLPLVNLWMVRLDLDKRLHFFPASLGVLTMALLWTKAVQLKP